MNHLPVLIPASLLFAAFLVPLAGLLRKSLAAGIAVAGSGLAALFSLASLYKVLSTGTMRYHFGGWAPPVGIEYVVDTLGAFMASVVTFVGFVAMIYFRLSITHEAPDRFVTAHAIGLLLLAGLSGMIVTGDLFNLFVFLEIASLSAYALVAIGEKRAPVAAFRYLILGSLGGSFYVLGVGFLYFSTGSLNMADVAQRLPAIYDSRAVAAAATLIAVAMALKMALFPLHLWLPDAYTYAPSAVAGLIPPIMTKVAAYVLIRIFLEVFQPHYSVNQLPVLPVVGWLSAAGIVFGSVMAIAQNDLRRMLAYSSVSQIGYVGLGFGMAHPLGLVGALLHILNHAFMKACLFFVAGAIRYRTSGAEIRRFTGLGRQMAWTMGAFTVAALSMIGVPPAAGFFSKWYLLLGAIEIGNGWFGAVILLSSLLNAAYFFRVLENVYAKAEPPEKNDPARLDPPASMLMPILLLAGGILVLGLLNSVIVTQVLEPIAVRLYAG
ncbi:MAG TPA: monovalent cation/H+ antiporter subunit D family protein [Candidatus Udaeobacter sp.]|nr:monovalent cation/H+ antiporter subunit D family protein [Candidatus Udaeobacter sp.]